MAPINSFDLFDTLVAAPDFSSPAGDQDLHFAIAENVRKVKPGDIIVSDYYDAPKAKRIVEEVLKLDNPLIVTNAGKASGHVWQQLKRDGHDVASHLDDAEYTFAGARQHGIEPMHSTLSLPTAAELELFRAGYPKLAKAIRQARLSRFDEQHRALELVTIEANFPFLYFASLVLDRYAAEKDVTRVLMCSRDAFLWSHLQKLFAGGQYEVLYFLSSRMARYQPSENYLKYVESLCDEHTLIVDLCGGGASLQSLQKLSPSAAAAKVAVMCGYAYPDIECFVQAHDDTVEQVNLAKHPMVRDVDADFQPVYDTAAGIPWASVEQIDVMHRSFFSCMENLNKYALDQAPEIDGGVMLLASLARLEASRAGAESVSDLCYKEEIATIRSLSKIPEYRGNPRRGWIHLSKEDKLKRVKMGAV